MDLFKPIILFCFAQLILIPNGFTQQVIDTTKIYGVTIDDVGGIDTICTSLRKHCKKMTARIAFDEAVPPSYYADAIDSIHNVAFTMGEIFDSYFDSSYTVPDNLHRATQYVNAFLNKIDIWEIGNEINGEWLGNSDSVKAKILATYNLVKSHGKKTALTLFYNEPCFYIPQNEMFSWINNYVPASMKSGLDYLLVSYYEDSCYNYQPNWQNVFDSLHALFPNSKLGMGECGTLSEANKDSFITRYYTMHITTPNYIGGYFWWYYKPDCVPYTSTHWTALNNAICNQTGITKSEPSTLVSENFPNPFTNFTTILFNLHKREKINLTIYDNMGRIVATLVDEEKDPGNYAIPFNADNLSEGVYLYKLSTSSEVITNTMILTR